MEKKEPSLWPAIALCAILWVLIFLVIESFVGLDGAPDDPAAEREFTESPDLSSNFR